MEQRKPLASNAREKDILLFEEIVKALPEKSIGGMVDCLHHDAFYRPEHADMFNKFIKHSEKTSWKFFDQQVQDYYENLKEARLELDSFLLEHFGIKGIPDITMHFEKKGTPFWNELKIELVPLTKKFDHTYKIFLEYGAKILYNNEKIPIARRKAPGVYKSGEMIYMVIGKDKYRIAKESTRQSMLWRSLVRTFGVPRSIDSVFDNIWKPKDEKNILLDKGHRAAAEQRKIIETTIKELRKTLAIHSVRELNFKIEDGKVWMEWRGKIE